jgi:hypothetical protein
VIVDLTDRLSHLFENRVRIDPDLAGGH